MSTASRWLSRRRQQLALVSLVLIVFVALLALWAGGSGDDSALSSPPSGSSTPVDPSQGSSPDPTTGETSSDTLPAIPGFGSVGGANRTNLTSYGPGRHRIVVTARSDKPMLAAGYSVRGERSGKIVYRVKSPVVIERTLSGDGPFAAAVLQMNSDATFGSCTITVDGKVADTRAASKAYSVIGCSA